jgi:hypothetical protein
MVFWSCGILVNPKAVALSLSKGGNDGVMVFWSCGILVFWLGSS